MTNVIVFLPPGLLWAAERAAARANRGGRISHGFRHYYGPSFATPII